MDNGAPPTAADAPPRPPSSSGSKRKELKKLVAMVTSGNIRAPPALDWQIYHFGDATFFNTRMELNTGTVTVTTLKMTTKTTTKTPRSSSGALRTLPARGPRPGTWNVFKRRLIAKDASERHKNRTGWQKRYCTPTRRDQRWRKKQGDDGRQYSWSRENYFGYERR